MLATGNSLFPRMAILALLLPWSAATAAASPAPTSTGWRTDGTGRYPEARPPTEWSSTANVVWRAELGDWSNATPVVLKDRLFVNVEPFTLVCLDRKTGRFLWDADHAYGEVNHDGDLPECHAATGYSTPTPATDGSRVYVLYGNGVAAAYSIDGKRSWIRLVDRPARGWGQSASPLLVGEHLILAVDEMFALDAATGEEAWRIPSKSSWGSPVTTEIGGEPVIITCAGQIVRPRDGKILAEGLGELEYNAPIVHQGDLYFMTGAARAYRLPEKLPSDGSKLELEPLWKARLKSDRYYSSPVIHQGKIYSITRSRILTVVDARTGEELEETRIGRRGGEMYSSITLAGEYLYLTGEDGRTAVVRPGASIEVLAHNKLRPSRACPVFLGTQLFMRAGNDMFCIAE